jgi:hypothetical protein
MTVGPTASPDRSATLGAPPVLPVDLVGARERIAAEIAQRQANILRAEADIGQAVLDGLSRPGAAPPDDNVRQEIARISAARGYIDQLGEQLRAIDAEEAAAGVQPDSSLSCPACRSPIVAGQRYCTVCGEEHPAALPIRAAAIRAAHRSLAVLAMHQQAITWSLARVGRLLLEANREQRGPLPGSARPAAEAIAGWERDIAALNRQLADLDAQAAAYHTGQLPAVGR